MSIASLGGLGQDQLLQLFVTQLQNQNPLEPLDNGELVAQLSTLSTMEALQNLQASFAQMLTLQQLTQGTDLLGKTIRYNSGGTEQSGVVTSVSVQNGNILLNVGSTAVPLDQVKRVEQTPTP